MSCSNKCRISCYLQVVPSRDFDKLRGLMHAHVPYRLQLLLQCMPLQASRPLCRPAAGAHRHGAGKREPRGAAEPADPGEAAGGGQWLSERRFNKRVRTKIRSYYTEVGHTPFVLILTFGRRLVARVQPYVSRLPCSHVQRQCTTENPPTDRAVNPPSDCAVHLRDAWLLVTVAQVWARQSGQQAEERIFTELPYALRLEVRSHERVAFSRAHDRSHFILDTANCRFGTDVGKQRTMPVRYSYMVADRALTSESRMHQLRPC